MKIMIVDAHEPSVPATYIIDTDVTEAPKHMMRMIARSSDKIFEHITTDCSEGSMKGLVNEDHDQARDHIAEIFEYIEDQRTWSNRYRPGMVVDAYISIATVYRYYG